MSKKSKPGKQEFALRQAEFLNGQGKSRDEIRALLGEQLATAGDIDVVAVLDKKEKENLVLAALFKHADEMGLSSAAVSHRYARTASDLRIVERSIVGSLRSIRSHVVLTALVALFVVAIYLNYVIPSFEALFTSFGADLPALTQLVIVSEGFRVLMLLIPIAAVAWIIYEQLLVKRVFKHCYFPRNPMWRFFLMAPTVREHFELLRYSFVQWALESHIPEDAALDVVDKIMGDISPMLVSTESKASNPLRVAARIGTLREEMKYRVDRLLIDVPLNAVIRRDRIGLMFSVIVGVIIAIMIFAMYLPLFKMGQVI